MSLCHAQIALHHHRGHGGRLMTIRRAVGLSSVVFVSILMLAVRVAAQDGAFLVKVRRP